MSQQISIYINEHPVPVDVGCTVRGAVRAFDDDLADALDGGSAFVTDGVGREIDPSGVVAVGDILRVVRSARRAGGSGGDA